MPSILAIEGSINRAMDTTKSLDVTLSSIFTVV